MAVGKLEITSRIPFAGGESFGDVGRWARTEVEQLDPLLGAAAALHLIRCQLSQAAHAGRLPADALHDLLSRVAPDRNPSP